MFFSIIYIMLNNMLKKEWRKDENDVMWAQRVGQSSEWGKV